jgi:2,5-diketo-D-gluconate reductase B
VDGPCWGDDCVHTFFQSTKGRLFGTYPLKGEQLAGAVACAITSGYRAFDTAQMYGNEKDLGEALATCGIARDDLFIVTKVHPDNYSPDRFLKSVEQSLKDLQTDRVDVLMLHWPPIGGDIKASLRLLAEAQSQKFTAHIGVSNYTAKMMREAAAVLDRPIACNQVEFHPLLDQSKLLAASAETGIPLCSYSAVARGEVFKHPIFAELAKNYGTSSAQVVLRWIWQKGVVVNTMSTNPENIRANWEITDFTLSEHDMARIDKLGAINYRVVTKAKSAWAPDWD